MGYIKHLSPEELKQLKKDRTKQKKKPVHDYVNKGLKKKRKS